MKKIISTILLDEDDNYTYEDGSLPKRPQWDKKLLATFLYDEAVSDKGYNMLPPSLQEHVTRAHNGIYPITVPEIDKLADILIVTRGKSKTAEGLKGKKFRFTKFEKVLETQGLEIWRKK